MADLQLCGECRYLYHSESRIPCLCCDSVRLTIPTSENLVGIVSRLLDRGIKVISSSCNIHDVYDDIKGYIGKTVQCTVELGSLYPAEMFNDPQLPPDWTVYKYHTIVDGQIGPAYTGLAHIDSFLQNDAEECEFATMVTITNLESWLDDRDSDAFSSVWKLAGVL